MSRTREELMWAGGLFTGEGTTCVNRSKGWIGVRMSLSNTDFEAVHRFSEALGNIGSITRSQGTNKSAIRWQTGSFEYVQAAVAMLWEFLTEQKREQAFRALSTYRKRRYL